MRKKTIDDIEIVEPPIGELTKKHGHWWKRTCLTSCGAIVLFLIAAFVAIRLFVGPGPSVLKTVPANFPDIPVYDRDAVVRITFISGRYKNRGLELAALFPKIILSPLFVALNRDSYFGQISSESTMIERQAAAARGLWQVITTPVADHRDSVQIEWRQLDAEPKFILAYYKKELEKKHFTIELQSEGAGVRQFSFSRGAEISGSLYLQADETARAGTDYAVLTVNFGGGPKN